MKHIFHLNTSTPQHLNTSTPQHLKLKLINVKIISFIMVLISTMYGPRVHSQCTTFDFPVTFTVTSANETAFLNVVENSTTNFAGDLIFDSSVGSMDINDAYMRFNTESDIIVLAGADVTFNECTLTSCNPSGKWKGIQVRGIPTAPWSGVQGSATIKQSRLENAIVGMSNYNTDIATSTPTSPSDAGGRIRVYQSRVTNCNQAVVLANYFQPNGHIFYESSFNWNPSQNFNYSNEGLSPMFEVRNNIDVPITRCNFRNTDSDVFYNGTYLNKTAVYVIGADASIIMTGNTSSGRISGFAYGIFMSQAAISEIRGIRFNNFRDVQLFNVQVPDVRSCVFDDLVPTSLQALTPNVSPFILDPSFNSLDGYGLYMSYCTDYTVSFNNFRFSTTAYNDFGIIILRSGEDNNLIEQNEFIGCDAYATSSLDDNREISGQDGLRFMCNTFNSSNFGDIYVGKHAGSAMGTIRGISEFQGEVAFGGLRSLGNSFGNISPIDNNPANGFHIYNVPIDVEPIDYYHHAVDNLQEADGDITTFTNNVQQAICAGLLSNPEGNNDGSEENLEPVNFDELADQRDEYFAFIQEDEWNLSMSEDEEEMAMLERRISTNKTKFNKVMNEAIAAISFNANHIPLFDESSEEEIEEYLLENSRENAIENILLFIDGKERLSDYYLLSKLYYSIQQFDLSQQYIDDIQENFDLSERQTEEYVDYLTCHEIRNDLRLEGITVLNEEQTAILTMISEKELNSTSGVALGMLMEYGNYTEFEYIPLKEDLGKSNENVNNTNHKGLTKKELEFDVYPNPSNTVIYLNRTDEMLGSTYTIYNINGKIMQSDVLTKVNNSEISVNNLPSGLYHLVLMEGKVIVGTSTFKIGE